MPNLNNYESCHEQTNILHICENKDTDQLRSNSEADQHLYFHYCFQNFPLLCLYSSVCVEPVQKPHCWFSHDTAYMTVMEAIMQMLTCS